MITGAMFHGRFRVLYALVMVLCAMSMSANGANEGAAAPPLTTLYNFPGAPGGAYPEGGVVMGASNSLFGTTYAGGAGWGTVYELTLSGSTWTETTIYTFLGSGGDGANPQGSLLVGANNILYGTTYNGGTYGLGTVYQLVPPSQPGGNWTESVVYSFKGAPDGQGPQAGLILNSAGNLYGTTAFGGTGACGTTGCGTVFQLKPNGSGGWNENVVYSFLGGCVTPTGGPTCATDGAEPLTELYLSKSGVFYGTTYAGGSTTASEDAGFGVVFQLSPGSTWKETVLYAFTGLTDGANPWSKLTGGPNSSLIGSTFLGGSPKGCKLSGFVVGCGTIYQLSPPASTGLPWKFSLIYTFTGSAADGAHPYGDMAFSGTLYGTTYAGGSAVNTCFPSSYSGCGTIFQIKPPATGSTTWTKSNLHAFGNGDGGGPNGLIHATTGALYGSTFIGGVTPGLGTVFEIQ